MHTTSSTGGFDSQYKGALVIDKGEERIIPLKKGVLDFEIEAGAGVFVIPLKAAK